MVHRADHQRPDGWTPNMILDDGGDLTRVMHEKYPELMKEVRACRRDHYRRSSSV